VPGRWSDAKKEGKGWAAGRTKTETGLSATRDRRGAAAPPSRRSDRPPSCGNPAVPLQPVSDSRSIQSSRMESQQRPPAAVRNSRTGSHLPPPSWAVNESKRCNSLSVCETKRGVAEPSTRDLPHCSAAPPAGFDALWFLAARIRCSRAGDGKPRTPSSAARHFAQLPSTPVRSSVRLCSLSVPPLFFQ
jgi:hypothetical protein